MKHSFTLRKGLLLAVLALLFRPGLSTLKAQTVNQNTVSRENVLVFQVDQLNGDDDAKDISSFLTSNFPDKIIRCTANGQDHTATIAYSSSIQPIDILQIFRQQGYHAWYVKNNQKFFLDAVGTTVLFDDIKPQ